MWSHFKREAAHNSGEAAMGVPVDSCWLQQVSDAFETASKARFAEAMQSQHYRLPIGTAYLCAVADCSIESYKSIVQLSGAGQHANNVIYIK
jgi:hypothetical protein